MAQYTFALILALIMSVMVILGLIDGYAKAKASEIIGRVIMGLIAILWFYMAWWGIYLN